MSAAAGGAAPEARRQQGVELATGRRLGIARQDDRSGSGAAAGPPIHELDGRRAEPGSERAGSGAEPAPRPGNRPFIHPASIHARHHRPGHQRPHPPRSPHRPQTDRGMAMSSAEDQLPCGTELDALATQIADGTSPTDPAHQARCPYCQTALGALGHSWDDLRALASAPVPVPPRPHAPHPRRAARHRLRARRRPVRQRCPAPPSSNTCRALPAPASPPSTSPSKASPTPNPDPPPTEPGDS